MNTKDFKTRSETIHRAAPCPANHWIIGLDIGYSAIKGMSPNKIYSVPAYARKIPADRVRLNEPSETDIYYKAENGDIWVVGSLAYNELSASREVCNETIEKLKSTHNYFADIDYIVATGGTYDAWSEQFNNVFRYMDGLQIIPGNINDPDLSNIYSNVRGYYYQRVNQIR